jgi:tRNA G18 (ribose-2'-O)-methylase SpoU
LASLDDPRLVPYRQLKDTNVTRWAQQFVVEGEKLVQRLLESRHQVISVVVDERCYARLPATIPPSVEVIVLPDGLVPSLVGFNFHRGMLACARRPTSPTLADLLRSQQQLQTLVVCPQIDDPENFGAILRIAAAFGVEGLLVGTRCPDPYSRRVMRVSMGAALNSLVVRSTDLAGDFDELRRAGFELVATVLDPHAEQLHQAGRGERLAIVLGSEGHGLDAADIAACDRRVTIDMHSGVDSLNVSVAAGICLYHFTRT